LRWSVSSGVPMLPVLLNASSLRACELIDSELINKESKCLIDE
jgi:hypothetical protein